MAAAVLPFSGCEWLHMNGRQSAMDAQGPVARAQLNLFYVTCWVTLVIFILVGSVLAYAMIKFRARSEADEHAAPPPQGHGNPFVEMGLIGASILALVVIAFPTLKGIAYDYDVPAAEKADAYQVTATGYQWWFKFDYPGEQIAGHGPLSTGNELVIPAGRAVHIDLRSLDVMHSFWVPKLAGKVDMIPNRAEPIFGCEADHAGILLGPVRGILRRVARPHAFPRDRPGAEGIRGLARGSRSSPRANAAAPAAQRRPRRISPPCGPSRRTRWASRRTTNWTSRRSMPGAPSNSPRRSRMPR